MNRYSGWKPDPLAFQRGVLSLRSRGSVPPGLTGVIEKAKVGGKATEEDVEAICLALFPTKEWAPQDVCAAACCAAMLDLRSQQKSVLETSLLEALRFSRAPNSADLPHPSMKRLESENAPPTRDALSPGETGLALVLISVGLLWLVKSVVKLPNIEQLTSWDLVVPVICLYFGASFCKPRILSIPELDGWTPQIPECIIRGLERVGSSASLIPLLDLKREAAHISPDICSRAIAHLLTLPRTSDFHLDSKYTPALCSILVHGQPKYRLAVIDAIGQYGNASALTSLAHFNLPGQKPEIIDAAHRAQATIQVREKMTKDARSLLRASNAPDSLLRPAELPDGTLLRPAGATTTPEQQLLRPATE